MGEDIEKFLDKIASKGIFKEKKTLQVNYTPENIPHREEQIKQVISILAPLLRNEKPSNLFIYGLTGTGKTLVITYVKELLLKKSKERKINIFLPYINCKLKKVADTEYRILVELLSHFKEKMAATGLPTHFLYKKLIDKIDQKNQLVVIIFDEIDQAVKKIGDNFLYNFTRLNSSLKNSQISIVGISNDLKFLDVLDPRVKSSLSEEEILFPPYNALQLKDILKERAKKAFKRGVLGEGVIEKCAAYAAREDGDARRALDLLRVAGEIAEREGKEKVTLEHVDKAKEKIEFDKIMAAIETQPKHFQITLLASINLLKKQEKVFTGDVYNVYRMICEKLRIEKLTQRRVSDIIAELDMLGIINAKVISKGRYGRTREIRIDLPLNLIKKIEKTLLNVLHL